MTTTEELRNKLVDGRGFLTGTAADLNSLLWAVIQAERKRILDASLFQFGMGDGTYMMIRTSVVDPKEAEHDH